MTMEFSEFIRCLLLHVLPDGFMKIRDYGISSNRNRETKLALYRRLLGVDYPQEHEQEKESWQELLRPITAHDPKTCPFCGKGKTAVKEVLDPTIFPLAP